MTKKAKIYPLIKRPLEYVAFLSVKLNTKEGYAYFFLAYNPFEDFIINLGMEKDESPGTVLKNIYFLMEDPHFVQFVDSGFTLVLEKYEELSEKIKMILDPVRGKMMFDKSYSNYLTLPVIQSLNHYFKNLSR
jgi:hypothetical protein